MAHGWDMDLHLSGKTALVTGASKGIGLATTRALLAEGAKVVAAARTVDGELGALPVEAVAVDLSTAEGPGRLVAEAIRDFAHRAARRNGADANQSCRAAMEKKT